jgi:serine/threonine-protein kinase HipA
MMKLAGAVGIDVADARTPRLSPGYDFVSTIAYIKGRKMALSVAKEKDTKRLDQRLLEKFAEKVGLPKQMVVQTALDTAEKTVGAWSEMASALPLQDQGRERIEEQLRDFPLTKQFLDVPRKNRPNGAATGKQNARARKPRS